MKYIGITTGPIFKTIKEAISPTGLWYASKFFSEVTKTLCEHIVYHCPKAIIFSPYFLEVETQDDGIGKYHDRILFTSPNIEITVLDEIVEKTKSKMVSYLTVFKDVDTAQIENFLSDYLQISFCIFDEKELDGKNIILTLNKSLDALELMATSKIAEDINYFERLFVGEDKKRNIYVQSSLLYQQIAKNENFLWQEGKGHFRSITDIARGDTEHSLPYFTVVNSDGDKFGRLLTRICQEDDENILPLEQQVDRICQFSKACLNYAKRAAQMINNRGGMTIYAGGDDLLFLSPVKPVLSICQELQQIFWTVFTDNPIFSEKLLKELEVSLSFGISIHYEKFPLYEAIEESIQLMYKAKNHGGNQIKVNITKHSGQAITLSITNNSLKHLIQFINVSHLSDEILQSLAYKINNLSTLFYTIFEQTLIQKWSDKTFVNIFCNYFDNHDQLDFREYLENVLLMYYHYYLTNDMKLGESIDKQLIEGHVNNLQSILSIIKFWNASQE
ncbi:type III-B CRISPR-associated protein Cas10/Cmr2 [Streptococcus sp. sy018]|uniref:type III-B CRISPR-associated protein Cas10/Cmr2 n=1 Tax=Streptococcus sp. sy018 TaxID=2600147 RepID=UPI0011B468CA|nr:type III-B CRISPR-associated protein Cas10/Cmr2 [Streptococcus sp. sy018]TWS95555.1 type III-B CRISPR-associated protein Cas10/Cmr2 [Streptococcus sp. sy018]